MDRYTLDFDLGDPRMKLSPRATKRTIAEAELALQRELPLCFQWWLTEFADGALFDIGNALVIAPLLGESQSVLSWTQWWATQEPQFGKDLIVFGNTCVDCELFAFYRPAESSPATILWIDGGSRDACYVPCATRFDRFLNIIIGNLLHGGTEPAVSSEEAADPAVIAESEARFRSQWMGLHAKYESNIRMVSDNFSKVQ